MHQTRLWAMWQKQLELYRAHNPRAASCIWQRLNRDVCWRPLPIVLGHTVMRMCRKMHYLWCSWPVSNRGFEAYRGQFFFLTPTSRSGMPRSSKLVIFVWMTLYPLCMRAGWLIIVCGLLTGCASRMPLIGETQFNRMDVLCEKCHCIQTDHMTIPLGNLSYKA